MLPSALPNRIEKILRSGAPASVALQEEDINSLVKLFGPSNRALGERFNLPLQRYNYLGLK